MPVFGRKRSKQGDQGRLQGFEKREKSESHGQEDVLEETTRRLQKPPSSIVPHSEDMRHQQETRSGIPVTCNDQQPSDHIKEEKHIQAPDHLSHESQSTQVLQSRDAQVQNKANNESAHFELPITESTQVQQLLQSQPQGKIAVAELVHCEQCRINTEQPHPGQNFQSESSRDTSGSIREPSPKRRGKRHRIKTALRQKAYSSSQEQKDLPDQGRLEKEPTDRKHREGAGRDPKRPSQYPPTSFPIQTRTDSAQSTTLMSDGRSEVPLARHNSSRHKPVTSQQESGLSRSEVERDQDSNSTVASRSEEEVDAHAWERHLPQSADDATIKHEVLTLFEFIEHHVDAYYSDAYIRISPAIADQLTKVPAPYLPDGTTLQNLLEQARYKTPVIKHCLISLVVSGMSFQDLPLFPLLPEEFTALPRAIRKETVDTRKKLCM
jgi:hypothetical protein